MTIINQLIKRLQSIHELNEQIKTAEKAKVPTLKQDAADLFKMCYEDFNSTQGVVNNLKSGTKEHGELHVMLAEAAFYTENFAICRSVIERYMQPSPQMDQFYCRCKLTLALVINEESKTLNGMESIRYHRLAVAEVMKALDVAVMPNNLPRYKFLVFNVSVAFWKIVNPFLRADRARFYVAEISRVVAALEVQDDPDKDWRVMLLSAAAVCCDDDKKQKEAVEYVDAAVTHAEGLLALTVAEEDKILAGNKAAAKSLEEIMSAFRAIEDREVQLRKPPKIDPDLPEDHVYEKVIPPPLTGLAGKGYEEVKTMLDESQVAKAASDAKLKVVTDRKTTQQATLANLYMQRIVINPSDSKRYAGLPPIVKYLRATTLVQLQCMISGCIPDKEWEPTFAALIKKLMETPSSVLRNETLLDVCRAAWRLKLRDVALKCYGIVAAENTVSPVIRVKLDACEAIRNLADIETDVVNTLANSRLSAKQAEGFRVSKRIEAIKLLERTIMMANTRLEDKFLVQEFCILMWNACIPLLQPHLRMKVYSSLKCITSTLEAVSSPLAVLRTQAHYEVAKCEEQSDFVVLAKTEGQAALDSDYGVLGDEKAPSTLTTEEPIVVELNRNRPMDQIIAPFVSLLAMRSSVFDTPADVEGNVLLWLQQARESKTKSFIVDMITKALYMMTTDIKQLQAYKDLTSNGLPVDYSILLLKIGAISIAEVPLDDVSNVLRIPRSGQLASAQPFTRAVQTQCTIMHTIVKLAHAVQHITILQQAALVLLSYTWDTADPLLFQLVDAQIETYYLLADSLLWRINQFPYRPAPADELAAEEDPESVEFRLKSMDPRTLGLRSEIATPAMLQLKQQIIQSLDKGIQLSAALKDTIGVQNGLVYFWNLHLHIFRTSSYYLIAMEEVFDLLKSIASTLDAVKGFALTDPSMAFDDRLKIGVFEALTGFQEARKQIPSALEYATKGASTPTSVEYVRRKIVETASRLTIVQATSGAPAKGGKAGSAEPPKFDSPILNVYSMLAQAEQPFEVLPKEAAVVLVDKIISAMDGEVATYLKSLKWKELSTERFAQLLEMQAECWCRLTRLRILFGDVIGSQATAERCLALVNKDNLSETDAAALSTRVWRWISVTERLFGIAITNIIQPEGQDASLQNELRLVALQHLVIATNYGIRAKNEELVVNAATNAWNIVIPLVEYNDLRERLFVYQRTIVDNLLLCKGVLIQPQVMALRQQYYLAMIEGYANIFDWDRALAMVMEAFESVSADLQKPLWQWRVIAMSKKGKSVLDGLQKLKENDPSLQAMVFIILARSSNNPKQQLEAYLKAVEILALDMERVDYMLEIAQWMATTGIPRDDISGMLLTAMDALYEVEERCMPEIADLDEDEVLLEINGVLGGGSLANDSTSKSGAGSKAGSRSSRRPSVRSNSRAGTSRAGTSIATKSRAGGTSVVAASKKASVRSEPPPVDHVPERLNFKQIEQCSRGLVMLAMLDAKVEARVEKHIEAVYFIRKGLQLWFDVLREMFRKSTYVALAEDVKANTPFDTFTVKFPEYLTVPEEPILLLPWINTHQKALIVLMQQAIAQFPLEVPSAASLPCVALTVHYLLQLSGSLYDEALYKYALLVLAYVRLLLLTASPVVEGYEAVLCAIHLKSIRVLYSLGLVEEAAQLSHFVLGSAADPSSLTITNYLVEYCRKAAINSTKVSNIKRIEKLADYTSPFGIATWTHQMDSKLIDPPLAMLDICETLLVLGQVPLCRNILVTIQKEFTLRGDAPRALLQCSTLLSRIAFMSGQYQAVMTSALAMRPVLSAVGDASQFGEQTQLLVRAYLRLGNLDEARAVAVYSMQLIEEASLRSIDKKALKPQVESQPTLKAGGASNVTLVGSNNASVVSRGSRKTAEGSNRILIEASYENVHALVGLTLVYVEVLLAQAKLLMVEPADPRPLYLEICDCLSKTNDLVTDVAGPGCDLSCQLLTARANVAVDFLTTLHESVSGLIGADVYASWLFDNLLMCSEYLERVVNHRRALSDSIPAAEGQYTSDAIVAKSIESTKDGVAALPPHKSIALPVHCELAAAEAQWASVQVLLAMVKSHHQSPTVFRDKPVLNPEQQYLQDTRPPAEHVVGDFTVQPLTLASQLSGAASLKLAGTDRSVDANLLYALSQVMQYCGEARFDAQWQPPLAEGANQELCVLSAEAEERRKALKAAAKAAIKASRFASTKAACSALVEAFGPNAPGQAACWLLQLHSINAREWLTSVWQDVLNPQGEIASSFARLQSLQSEPWPTAAAVRQIDAEKAFLRGASVCYRRLSVSQDPLAILNTALPASTVLLCLQYCPLRETVYVCAGSKAGAPAAPAPAGKAAPPAKGAAAPPVDAGATGELDSKLWFLDKAKLSEAQRRSIQTIKVQHKQWTVDATKFAANFGESTSADFDVEGNESTFESKTLKKAERALAERLRALVEDLEAVFAELLGPSSRLQAFLAGATAALPKASLLMLLDVSLQSMPWEALSFGEPFEGRTSRDFSLHMLYHRLTALCVNPAAPAAADPNAPLVVPPLLPLNASGVKYLVDPLAEDTNGNKTEGFKREPMTAAVADLLQKGEIAGGAKWTKVRDRNGLVSLQDWTAAMDQSALAAANKANPLVSLFVYSLGRFGSLLRPDEAVTLNLERLALYVGLDSSQNDASFRRQNSSDVLKKAREIESEQSLNMAAAMALSGVGAQFIHLWAVPIVGQQRLAALFWRSFSTKKDRLVLSVADAGARVDAAGTKTAVKKWIRCSRVLYGVPNISYNDAA